MPAGDLVARAMATANPQISGHLPHGPVVCPRNTRSKIRGEDFFAYFAGTRFAEVPELPRSELDFLAVSQGESQRDSVAKPRVARDELPWESVVQWQEPQRGCALSPGCALAKRGDDLWWKKGG